MYIERWLYPSIVDIIVDMNDKVRKGIGAQNYEYDWVYVSVDKVTQKLLFIYLRINQCLKFKVLICAAFLVVI